MWFAVSSVVSGLDKPAQNASGLVRRDQFLCGGILLVLTGWIASHPLPRAPDLPSVCQSRMSEKMSVTEEVPAEQQILVWLDTRTGTYYFPGSQGYGSSPNGRYVEQKTAKAQGYCSSAKR